MSWIVDRGLDKSGKARLAARAKQHRRSKDAGVRGIQTKDVSRPGGWLALLRIGQSVGVVDESSIPAGENIARVAELSWPSPQSPFAELLAGRASHPDGKWKWLRRTANMGGEGCSTEIVSPIVTARSGSLSD